MTCEKALRQGFEKTLTQHARWWQTYWDGASVSVPNPIIERQWYLETYKFGAAARSGSCFKKNIPPSRLPASARLRSRDGDVKRSSR